MCVFISEQTILIYLVKGLDIKGKLVTKVAEGGRLDKGQSIIYQK